MSGFIKKLNDRLEEVNKDPLFERLFFILFGLAIILTSVLSHFFGWLAYKFIFLAFILLLVLGLYFFAIGVFNSQKHMNAIREGYAGSGSVIELIAVFFALIITYPLWFILKKLKKSAR